MGGGGGRNYRKVQGKPAAIAPPTPPPPPPPPPTHTHTILINAHWYLNDLFSATHEQGLGDL